VYHFTQKPDSQPETYYSDDPVYTSQWVTNKIEEIEALQLLLGVKTHELNESMTVILGVSDFLLSRDIPADLSADLQVITHQIKYMNEVIKRLDHLTEYKLRSHLDGI
jgi:signal transduction histidine kinase